MENGIKERNISTRFELSIEKLKSNIIHEVDLSNDKSAEESSKLTSNDISILAQVLRYNTGCYIVNLKKNRIGDEGATELGKILEHNYFIQKMFLGENAIGVKGAEALSRYLKISFSLQKLSLDGNKIGDSGAKFFAEAIPENNSLQELDLSNNGIEDEGARFLLRALSHNFSLQKLDLSENPIIDKSILSDISRIQSKNREHSLKFSSSKVEWHSIFQKQNLRVLIIFKCGVTEIPPEICKLQELKILDFQQNEIVEIPNLEPLSQLITLNLTNNKIKILKFDKWQLPRSLKKLHILGCDGISKYTQENINQILSILTKNTDLPLELQEAAKILVKIGILNDCTIENIIEKVKNYETLHKINLNQNGIYSISDDILGLRKCTSLMLNNNQISEFPSAIAKMKWIKKLDFRINLLTSLPEQIESLTSLKEIWLEANKFTYFPSSLKKLTSLQRIWMDKNEISSLPEISMVNLQRLSLSFNKLSNINSVVNWKLLQFLFLNSNQLESLPPEIKNLNQLKKLQLNENKLTSLPDEIAELVHLEELQLRANRISELPIRIGELYNLKHLDLFGNQLKALPPSMAFLNLEICNLKDNQLQPPLQDARLDQWNHISKCLLDLLTGTEICNNIKMIVVGEECTGKTTLIKTLKAYCSSRITFNRERKLKEAFSSPSTPTDGIEILPQAFELKLDKKHRTSHLIYSVWEFGGNEVHYPLQSLFLSGSALYVITFNLIKREEELEKLMYWVKTLESIERNACILLVGTHLDSAHQLCLETVQIIQSISRKTNIPPDSIIAVSCSNGENFDKLVELLIEKSSNLSITRSVFPRMYFNLKNKIDEIKPKNPIIKFSKFLSLANECFIIGEEVKKALRFFHTLGYCLYFENDELLKDNIVLDPQTFARIVSTVISFKTNSLIQGAIIEHKHFKTLWKDYRQEEHKSFLTILQQFYLLVPMSSLTTSIYEGKSLVPSFVSSRNLPEEFTSWNHKENKLKRIYFFNQLPADLFSRLLSLMFFYRFNGTFLENTKIRYWKDGILVILSKAQVLFQINPKKHVLTTIFAGENWYPFFCRIKILLSKWEQIQGFSIGVFCLECCCKFNGPDETWEPCFKWNELSHQYFKGNASVYCSRSKSEIKILDFIPELLRLEIRTAPMSEVFLQEKIKESTFAEEYKGTYKREDVYVKKLKTEYSTSEQKLLQELEILHNECHPNLVEISVMVSTPPCLVIPLTSYGLLSDILTNPDVELKLPLCLRFLLDISNGMNFLHELNPPVLHCDLNPSSALIYSLEISDNVVAKLTDFGLTQSLLNLNLLKEKKKLNPKYIAPEIFLGESPTTHSDVYSFGMILYELLTREPPFHSKYNPDWNSPNLIEGDCTKGIRPPYYVDIIEKRFNCQIPSKVFHILKGCWNEVAIKRPSFRLILLALQNVLKNHWNEVTNYIKNSLLLLPSRSIRDLPPQTTQIQRFNSPKLFQKSNYIGNSSTYARTYFCFLTKMKGKYVMKEIEVFKGNSSFQEKFLQEVEILENLTKRGLHKNVAQMVAYFLDFNHTTIISEFYEGGSLDAILKRVNIHEETFSRKEITQFCIQILAGLNYLHTNKIAHGNLKTSNIMVKLDDVSSIKSLHLSDYGSSSLCHFWKIECDDNRPLWIAPEILTTSDLFLADIWSFGIVLYEFAGGTINHLNFTKREEILNLWPATFHSTEEFKPIFESCIQLEPKARPSIELLLKKFEGFANNV